MRLMISVMMKSSTDTAAARPVSLAWRRMMYMVTVVEVGATIKVRQANTPPNKAERCSFFDEDLEVVA